jgi:hypothetical protein
MSPDGVEIVPPGRRETWAFPDNPVDGQAVAPRACGPVDRFLLGMDLAVLAGLLAGMLVVGVVVALS